MFIRLWLYKKNHYRLIAVHLSSPKELDADPKAIQQIEFVGQLKKLNAEDNAKDAGDNDQSMLVLTILEKNQRNEIKIFSGEWNSIIKDGELSRSKSETNKCTIKQIKICCKK